jgi:MSHA biogenesis protein MshN
MSEAEAKMQEVLTINPKHKQARVRLSGIMVAQERWLDAMQVLGDGLKYHPDYEPFVLWQARVLVEQKAEPEALALLEERDDRGVFNPEYTAFMAALYQKLGEHEKASIAYRRALQQSPREGRWWLGLAMSLEAQRRWPAAEEAYVTALEDNQLETHLVIFLRERLDYVRQFTPAYVAN